MLYHIAIIGNPMHQNRPTILAVCYYVCMYVVGCKII